MDAIEIHIVRFFNALGKGHLDVPLRFLSSIRFLAVLWMTLVTVAVLKNAEIVRPFLGSVLIVTGLHFSVTEGIFKRSWGAFFPIRKRPYVAYPEIIKPIGHRFHDASFPSSHMASTVAMLFVIVSFYPSLLSAAIFWSCIIAFSRLHNGMHYPTDVLAGTALGMVYGWVAVALIR